MNSTEGPSPAVRPGKPGAWYAENPQARMSFSRLASFRRCPGWFRYQYLDWHRTWSTPILRVGHAVQEALERVFDGVPAEDVTLDSLEERAFARMAGLFEKAWEKERASHEADPNGFGDWDLPRERYEGYLRAGLRWHLDEVRACLAGRHPRTGKELGIAPVSRVAAAWEAVRPWHAPHGASFQEGMETIPDGYFQGQYDLVYAWTGGRRIVDLKASTGSSAFSTEIRLQLLSYAWMERELRRGRPEGIEAWFLGADAPQEFEVPGDDELDEFGRRVVALIDLSGIEKGFGDWDRGAFPPEPSPVEGFLPSGDEPSRWCAYCPAALTCPRTSREAPAIDGGVDFGTPPERGPVELVGTVLGVGEPRERAKGKVTCRFTLANRTGIRSFTWGAATVDRLIKQGLRAGRTVRISAVRPWKHPASGDTLYYDSAQSRLQILET